MRKLTAAFALVLLIVQRTMGQFSTVAYLSPLPVTTDTKAVPQSKIWMYNDKYWAVLTNKEGTHVWRLDGISWTKILTIGISEYGRADCKVAGNLVHIFLNRERRSYLYSIEYVPEKDTYQLWRARPERVVLQLPKLTEATTIDLDSRDRMWLAYDDSTSILVRWSDSPYDVWSKPITLAPQVTEDDIGTIIALPMFRKIGVFWSDQNSRRFGFRLHTDGADPESWSADEVPASQSALTINGGMANDHMSLALASDGTLYCAVKTSYRERNYPKLALLVRRRSGSWDNLYYVSDKGTQGIALLNEQTGKIRVVYTANEAGGDIRYREADIDKIEFGPPHTLLHGKFKHSTGMKNNTTPHFLVLASDSLVTTGVAIADFVKLQLEASPNPFETDAVITFSVPANTAYEVKLYNIEGKYLYDLKEGQTKYGEKHTLPLSAWPLKAGLYIVRLQTARATKAIKLVRL